MIDILGILSILFFIVSRFFEGYFKGMADTEMRTGNFAKTSDNKYAKDENGNKIPAPTKGFWGWYHKFFRLKHKEVKPFYATLLVSRTDKWHYANAWRGRFDFLQDVSGLAMAMYITSDLTWWIQLLVLSIMVWVASAGFHFKYTRSRDKN